MQSQINRINAYLAILNENRTAPIREVTDILWTPAEYKIGNALPDRSEMKPFDVNSDRWGNGTDTHAWFCFDVDVPASDEDREVFLQMQTLHTDHQSVWDPSNPQFLVYVDGELTHGLDRNHSRHYFKAPGKHTVYLYAYTGDRTLTATLRAKLYWRNVWVEKLYYDIRVPMESLNHLQPHEYAYPNILKHLTAAVTMLDLYRVPSEAFLTSVNAASDYMDNTFYGEFCSPAKEDEPVVVGIGHTHIDCAWLWTLKQTREKVQRSFSTVVSLMERYPEYLFMSSQAFLYQNLKEEQPALYARIGELIREGRWECEGAMWVEADCNLSGGEALIRQVLYGKRFFQQEFGVDNRVLWLPDVFGYSAALPQILRKSGVDWFVTSKISWNDTNKLPVDTFLWKGIDGTGIPSFFLTAQNKSRGGSPARTTTYVAHTTPAMVAGTYDRYQQKDLNNETLLTFGWGDGGGGPTEEHLEMARRLSKGIPGTPTLKIDFAGNMLSRLEKKIKDNPRLPIWQGELYLEFHRGTYTSQAKNKKNNRQSEYLYLNTEWLCSLQKHFLKAAFPKDALHRGWEMLLTNQFHDIIPGSSIRQVYEQCDIDYETIRSIASPHLSSAAEELAGALDQRLGYVVYNPNPTVGKGTVRMNGVATYVEGIPAKGYACVEGGVATNHVKLSNTVCENDFFRLAFNEAMQITSIYDKRNRREVLRHGGLGNELRIYADRPHTFDAWELTDYTLEQYQSLTDVQSVTEVQDGVRAGLRITRRFLDSTLIQTVWLYDCIDRIDFDLDVDWKEHHEAIKVAFDVDINASRATYDIQYGWVERPTHKNTSWERAQFEVCGHKFADFSEGGYGVALFNDCKYGYDIHGSLMTLTLLRSPTYPDPEADIGRMTCTYSLYPHKGAADMPTLYTHAYAINNPMIACPTTGAESRIPTRFETVCSDSDSILCETVKEAEDSTAHLFRFYECNNTRQVATLRFGFPVAKVTLCDMQEKPIRELTVTDNAVELEFGAFEIHSLLVEDAD